MAKCKICQVNFAKKGVLNRHVAFVHEGKKPFQCEICDHEFSENSKLKRHIATIHESKKQFKGNKASVHEENKKVKKKTRKYFNCSTCDYNFSHKCAMIRHIESVHERKKPFKCEICDYNCDRKATLRNHIISVHEKIKIKDKNCNCKDKKNCPLNNKCKVEKGIVYEANVKRFSKKNEPENVRKYIGSTSLTFKERFNVHSHSFKNNSAKNSTALSRYVRQGSLEIWTEHYKSLISLQRPNACELNIMKIFEIVSALVVHIEKKSVTKISFQKAQICDLSKNAHVCLA